MKIGIFDISENDIYVSSKPNVTIYFQGCPLNCIWCHNPEGKSFDIKDNRRKKTPYYPKEYTMEQIIDLIQKYQALINPIGGYIVFSGGEPLAHFNFLIQLADKIVTSNIILDTSGYLEPNSFVQLADKYELYLFDIKLLDDEKHIRYTGVSNKSILQNINYLMQKEKSLKIRIPIIPGINDTLNAFSLLYDYLSKIDKRYKIEMLKFNGYMISKYKFLDYQLLYKQYKSVSNDFSIFQNMQASFEVLEVGNE